METSGIKELTTEDDLFLNTECNEEYNQNANKLFGRLLSDSSVDIELNPKQNSTTLIQSKSSDKGIDSKAAKSNMNMKVKKNPDVKSQIKEIKSENNKKNVSCF